MLTKSNAVGYAVLALVIDNLRDDELHSLSIEPYLNGRENGFALHLWNLRPSRKLAFARNRNCDSIVIYEGHASDFSMQGNTFTDAVYAAKVWFNHDEHHKAALHIVEGLRGELP